MTKTIHPFCLIIRPQNGGRGRLFKISADRRGAYSTESANSKIYGTSTNTTFSFQSCSSDEVRKLLEKLETKKATGLDNLPFKMLKIAAGVQSPSLAFLLNQSISSGIVPTEWKLARVTQVLKRGKREDVNNYWQISIIPHSCR